MAETKSKLHVVVVGAGAAGLAITQALDKKLDPARHELTLLTSKDYFLLLPATLRMVVTEEDKLEDHAALPYDTMWHGSPGKKPRVGKIQFGEVVSVVENAGGEGGELILAGDAGERVKWDVLVVATGSKWSGPLSFPKKKEELDKWVTEWRAKFSSAKKIVLVGGGAVGCEIAGEIRDYHPDAKVTLVHGLPQLLNPVYPAKLRNRVGAELTNRGVELVLDDLVENLDPASISGTASLGLQTVKTKKGKEIEADLVIPTFGSRGAATDFLSASASPSAPSLTAAHTSPLGKLDVKPTLQLKSNPRVFGAGDVIQWDEQAQLMKTGPHAGVVVQNVTLILNSIERKTKVEETPGLKNYTGFPELITITNGKSRGSMYAGVFGLSLTFGDWLSKTIKSKGLLVPMAKSAIGAK